MKTKIENMRVKFTKECENATQLDKPIIERIRVIDKKTERVVVDARIYMSASANASMVHCALWVTLKQAKKPTTWSYPFTTGKGSASGYGYHKASAALQAAISSAGIEIYGSPYNRAEPDNMKKRAFIDGCGETAMRDALMAIAYAAGFTDCIYVS